MEGSWVAERLKKRVVWGREKAASSTFAKGKNYSNIILNRKLYY